MKKALNEKFEELFGAGGEIRTYFAPGRVNLIGEHTDLSLIHISAFGIILTCSRMPVSENPICLQLNWLL